jgi:hypothetical protein
MGGYSMKKQGLAVPSVLALLIGLVHTFFIILCWAYIAVHSPLPSWLMAQGITGQPLHVVLFVADLLVNVLLCLPAAYLLCKLQPSKLALYLFLAVVPGFLWQYHGLFTAPMPLGLLSYGPGILLALVPLPITTLLIKRAVQPGAPNNSFKPNPLRGSA